MEDCKYARRRTNTIQHNIDKYHYFNYRDKLIDMSNKINQTKK